MEKEQQLSRIAELCAIFLIFPAHTCQQILYTSASGKLAGTRYKLRYVVVL